MEVNISQLQAYGSAMLKTVTQLLEDAQIPYSMIYGSLLGAVRHNGPIPWDYDIDIAIPENEMERFLKLMESKLPEAYWLDYRQPGRPHRTLPRIGLAGFDTLTLHIDIYRIVGIPASRLGQRLFLRATRTLVSLRCAKVYKYSGKKKVLAELVKLLTFMVPADSFAHLFDRLCRKYPVQDAVQIGVSSEADIKQALLPRDFFDTEKIRYSDFSVAITKQYDSLLRQFYGDYMQFPPEEERNALLEHVYHIEPLRACSPQNS